MGTQSRERPMPRAAGAAPAAAARAVFASAFRHSLVSCRSMPWEQEHVRQTVTIAAIAVALAVTAGATSARPRTPGGTPVRMARHRRLPGPQRDHVDPGRPGLADGAGELRRPGEGYANGSQATVPGTHPLSSSASFDYGLGAGVGWYMTGKPDAWNGKTLTAAQIRGDFAATTVAWVGIDDSGTTDYGYVTSVNGHRANAILGLEAPGGSVTAFVLRFPRDPAGEPPKRRLTIAPATPTSSAGPTLR